MASVVLYATMLTMAPEDPPKTVFIIATATATPSPELVIDSWDPPLKARKPT